MKESEQNQDVVGLDMAKGLHPDGKWMKYPQKFVKAPESLHPSKAPSNGKAEEPAKIMSMTCHAKG
jgi:hypothetical protein